MENFAHTLHGFWANGFSQHGQLKKMVRAIDDAGIVYGLMDDQKLGAEVDNLRLELHTKGFRRDLIESCFALVREFSDRILGMRHYQSQLLGGLVMLQGRVAEMETGEGKTLTATLPAVTMALAGVPVHIITVNDYLTSRDARSMGPLFQAMKVKAGCVVHGLTPSERRKAYGCDVTYVTNKEIVFDYLRDRLSLSDRVDASLLQMEYLHSSSQRSKQVLLRGLHFAIVDEADSILIDEARTPLIISGSHGGDEERQFLQQALDVANKLTEKEDYILELARRRLRLTLHGKQQIEHHVELLGPLWKGLVRRESTVQQALTAINFYHRDKQYLLRDGKVQIIDEFTGRVMEDRSWEQGLHQLIELKEGCALTQRRETLAKISYQKFFRRYLRLSGMTGTAKEVAGEFWSVYHLPTIRILPNRPLIRKKLKTRVYGNQQQKWSAVVDRICELHQQERPVLVGTLTVSASEYLSALITERGLDHQVLNAKHDESEANVVRKAGNRGSITIATNMAGRGTDILLGKGVLDLGGLHVIATERHDAARIDRQLAGRCGRQGDPGSHETMLSLEDLLLEGERSGLPVQCAMRILGQTCFGQVTARLLMNYVQRKIEKDHARIRRNLFHQAQGQRDLLSFSGTAE
ncbi:MAG: preprotein translocase subunit SecA [Desulforhopalus sp.]|nr:preprotein translocase subunit SecA [Desulforhopalus sp.]